MIEKEKVLRITKNLIENKESVLNTKYSHSHEKIAIIYREHILEIIGGDKKAIKYSGQVLPLSKDQYKEIYKLFMGEMEKRKGDHAVEKFNELENLMNNGNGHCNGNGNGSGS